MKLIKQNLHFKATSFDDENFIVRGIFSTPTVDRQGEVIDQNGWKLDEYLQNPVVLFAHDHSQPAIGKMAELGKDAQGNLAGAIQFAAKEYDFANTIYQLYKGGYMRAFSVGFSNSVYEVDQANDVIILKENVLYEVSAVNVPANAMALASQKGIDMKPLERMMKDKASKGVCPFVASPMRPEGASWDANAVQTALWDDGKNQAKYAKIHAWFDDHQADDDGDGYPDVKSAYKLPHHDADLKVVWAGVAAAMGALMGARGGVSIPDGDKMGVYNHLKKHYDQFGKEAPEMKAYTAEELKQIEETGSVKKVSLESIQTALEGLTDALKAVAADNQEGLNGRTPLENEGGNKKVSVRTLNRAIRELVKAKNKIKNS